MTTSPITRLQLVMTPASDQQRSLEFYEALGFETRLDVDPEVARHGSAAVVRLGAVEQAGPVPAMFWFRDPDGTQLLVVEAG